jgi:predicted patatin/cPLA2 family phospholipase
MVGSIPKSLVIALFMASASQAADQKKTCKTLVLSGGANKGAWEVGVLDSWVKGLAPEDVQYDVFSGVSIGAMNSGLAVGFEKGDEANMSEYMVNFWRNVTQDQIYKEWPDKTYEGMLFNHSGIYDNSPLVETATAVLNRNGIKKKIVIGSVDSNTGEYHVFNEQHEPKEELPKVVAASASVPFVFPHMPLANGTMIMMDGGTVYNTNLIAAADRCLEEVDSDEQIVMDVMVCDYIGRLQKYTDEGKAYDNYLRNWAISSYYKSVQDITEFMRTRPNIQFRYMATASKPLTWGPSEMEIDAKTIWPMIDLGIADGKDIVAKGPGYYFKKLLEFDEAGGHRGLGQTFSDFI